MRSWLSIKPPSLEMQVERSSLASHTCSTSWSKHDRVVRGAASGERAGRRHRHRPRLALPQGWHHPAGHWHRTGAQRGDQAQVFGCGELPSLQRAARAPCEFGCGVWQAGFNAEEERIYGDESYNLLGKLPEKQFLFSKMLLGKPLNAPEIKLLGELGYP